MKRSTEILLVVGIVLVAGFFRLYDLVHVPAGLSPIEAYVGNEVTLARDVLGTSESGTLRPHLFVTLQSWGVAAFGHTPWALRVIPALAGTLTVLGLYLLTRTLFGWHTAALAAFLLAVSPWHVTFSRAGFAEILIPLVITWGAWLFWRALRHASLGLFAVAGVVWGLGLYAHAWFWIFLAIPACTVAAHWHMMKNDFDRSAFSALQARLARGVTLTGLVLFLVWLPLGIGIFLDPDATLIHITEHTPLASGNALGRFVHQVWQTVVMFIGSGDPDWLHGIAGAPLLWWPLAACAVVGFIKSILKLAKRMDTHGHVSPAFTLILSWFVVGLLPSALTKGPAPDALRTLAIAPVVMIFAAQGLSWVIGFVARWYGARDVHVTALDIPGVGHRMYREARIVAGALLGALLATVAVQGYSTYFGTWASHPGTARAYARQVTVASRLIAHQPLTRRTQLYIPSDYSIAGMPAALQTFMFITDTATLEKQKARNVIFLTPEQYRRGTYPRAIPLITLEE